MLLTISIDNSHDILNFDPMKMKKNIHCSLERIDIPDISGIPVYVQIPVLAICI